MLLKSNEIKQYRDALLIKQDHCCALCGYPVLETETPHLDHDHKTGYVRGVVHASCNRALGILETSFSSFSRDGLAKSITKIIAYLNNEDLPAIYPTHTADLAKKFYRLSKPEQIKYLSENFNYRPELNSKHTKKTLTNEFKRHYRLSAGYYYE